MAIDPYSHPSVLPSTPLPVPTLPVGVIQCNSTLTTGTALVSGLNRTYTNFSRQTLYNSSDATGGEPLLDPMFAAFYYLANKGAGEGSFQLGSAIRGLGFQYRDDVGPNTEMTSASPELISEGLWGAVAHFTSAIAVLSRDTDLTFPAQIPRPVAVYTRDKWFAVGAYGLLALWLVLVGVVTAWGVSKDIQLQPR